MRIHRFCIGLMFMGIAACDGGPKFEGADDEDVIYACFDGDPDCEVAGSGGSAGSDTSGSGGEDPGSGGSAGSDTGTGGTGGDTGTGGSADTGGISGSAGSDSSGGEATGGDAGSGTSGTGGDSGTGGSAGSGTGGEATGGSAGSGTSGTGATGGAGTGGSAGEGTGGINDSCTGIYFAFESAKDSGTYNSVSGPQTVATYQLYGTSPSSPLSETVVIYNDPTGDFASSTNTPALEYVRLRCQDPVNASSYITACQGTMVNGVAECTTPTDCYSNSGAPVTVLLQIKPFNGGSGAFRVGLKSNDPNVNVCGAQDIPVSYVTP